MHSFKSSSIETLFNVSLGTAVSLAYSIIDLFS